MHLNEIMSYDGCCLRGVSGPLFIWSWRSIRNWSYATYSVQQRARLRDKEQSRENFNWTIFFKFFEGLHTSRWLSTACRHHTLQSIEKTINHIIQHFPCLQPNTLKIVTVVSSYNFPPPVRGAHAWKLIEFIFPQHLLLNHHQGFYTSQTLCCVAKLSNGFSNPFHNQINAIHCKWLYDPCERKRVTLFR